MSSHHPDAAAAEPPGRDLSKKSVDRWNRRAPRPVVQVVGRSRGVATAVVTAGVILSGCASADGGEEAPTTTSPAVAVESGNPWDLPVEQRPDLFDPCAEIPVEAIEEAVGRPVEPNDVLRRHEPDQLMACGWADNEVHFTSAASWKTRSEYLADPGLVFLDRPDVAPSRGVLMTEAGDTTDRTCMHVFFTERGTSWVKLDLVGGLSEFHGQRFSDACQSLDQVMDSIENFVPKGDFA